MAMTPQHIHQVLTKRAERMADYCGGDPIRRGWLIGKAADNFGGLPTSNGYFGPTSEWCWPLPNVWLGVSIEDQQRKARIDILRDVPAAVRFLSLEPLLEDLGQINLEGIHWGIVGGESGRGARPCNIAWVRSIRDQCKAAGVACFIKQLGSRIEVENDSAMEWPWQGDEWWIEDPDWRPNYQGELVTLRMDKKGGDWSEWPEDLRVREFPTTEPSHEGPRPIER